MFNDFRREFFVVVVDFGIIVDYHCLNFLFTTQADLVVHVYIIEIYSS